MIKRGAAPVCALTEGKTPLGTCATGRDVISTNPLTSHSHAEEADSFPPRAQLRLDLFTESPTVWHPFYLATCADWPSEPATLRWGLAHSRPTASWLSTQPQTSHLYLPGRPDMTPRWRCAYWVRWNYITLHYITMMVKMEIMMWNTKNIYFLVLWSTILSYLYLSISILSSLILKS